MSSSAEPLSPTSARATAAAAASADLEIFAEADEPLGAGDPFVLYIFLSNYGPDTATGVTFADTLPAGSTFQSVKSASSGVSCSHAAGVVTCTAASVGEEYSVVVALNVLAPAADGPATNHVAITAQTPADPYLEDNSHTTSFDVRSDAEVSVFQTASNVAVGEPATFRVFLRNDGPKPATDVSLTVHLPEETDYVSHVAPAGMTCTPAGHTLTCSVPTLPRLAEHLDPPMLTVTVGGLATAGILTSVAEASAASPADSDPDNNEDAQVVVVGSVPLADLHAYASSASAVVGIPVVLRTDVQNDGPQAAAGVQVVDKIPAGFAFVSASMTGGTCSHDAGTVTCSLLGALAADSSRDIKVTVTPSAVGTFTHAVEANAGGPADPDPDGNSGAGTIHVFPAGSADLAVFWTGPETVLANADARYTLIAWNSGPSSVSGATIAGTLPAGVEYVSSTTPSEVACSYDGGTRVVSCTLGTLPSSTGLAFDVVLRRAATGTLSAAFTISYALELEPGDNTESIQSSVVAAGTAGLYGFWWTQSAFTPQGMPMRLRFGAGNDGPATAEGVTASIQLPASMTFVSASSPYGSCGNTGGLVTCALGSIPADDARAASVIATPTALGPVTVIGSVAEQSPSIDPATNDNGLLIGMTIVSAVVSAPTATMPGAQSITDPATGEVQVIASADSVGPLTLGAAAQCPGGGPIGANPVTFSQAGIIRTATPVGGRFEATYTASQVDEVRFYGRVQCAPEASATQNRIGTIDFFDPVGSVTNAATGAPITGASATLYRVPGWMPRIGTHQDAVPATCESTATKPDGTAWSQAAPSGLGVVVDERSGLIDPAANPMATNATGAYGWFMEPAGCWYITVSKPGYATTTSPVFGTFEFDEPSALNLKLQPIMRTLSVTATTGGTVSSNPGGILCPTDCSESFLDGTVVTLTASPTTPTWKAAWSGACAGTTANTCIVDLGANKTVGVTFSPPDTKAPALKVTLGKQSAGGVLRFGVVSKATVDEACVLKYEVRLSAATARKLKLPAVVGSATKTMTRSGTVKLGIRLKPAAKKKLKKIESLRVTLVVTAKDAAGNARKVTRTATISD